MAIELNEIISSMRSERRRRIRISLLLLLHTVCDGFCVVRIEINLFAAKVNFMDFYPSRIRRIEYQQQHAGDCNGL